MNWSNHVDGEVQKFNPNSDTGIYFLIKNKEVVYVGQSIGLHARLASHLSRRDRGKDYRRKDFDDCYFINCNKADLDKLETYYIFLLKPRLNGRIYKKTGNQSFHVSCKTTWNNLLQGAE